MPGTKFSHSHVDAHLFLRQPAYCFAALIAPITAHINKIGASIGAHFEIVSHVIVELGSL